MLGGGDGALGGLPIEQWWFEMPPCTRWWTTATVVTGILVQCQILTPFQLFYSFRAVFHKQQVSRQKYRQIYDCNTTLKYITVLATAINIRLLRSTITQSLLPHLLHPTIRTHARRISSVSRTLLMAPRICIHHASYGRSTFQPGIPGHNVEFDFGVHME